MNIQTNPNDNENHYKRIGSQRKNKAVTDFVTINPTALRGKTVYLEKWLVLAFYHDDLNK